jgi:hypothetical protein
LSAFKNTKNVQIGIFSIMEITTLLSHKTELRQG